MAVSKSPAFQFYPGDFLADANVVVMSTEEVGAYFLLTLFAWRENSLPDDVEELCLLARMPLDRFQISWEKRIGRCFVKREDGRFVHPRLEVERAKQQAFREQMSEAGKRGGRPRKAEGSDGKRVGLENGKGKKALLSSSSNNTPIVPNADVQRVLDRYASLHPKRKIVGEKLPNIVRKALKDFSPEDLIEALEGNASDAWHRERGKHELGYVLRDADMINGFRAKAIRNPAVGVPDARDGAW